MRFGCAGLGAQEGLAVWVFSDQYALRMSAGRGAGPGERLRVAFWDGTEGWAREAAGKRLWARRDGPLTLPAQGQARAFPCGNCQADLRWADGALRLTGRAERLADGQPLLFDVRLSAAFQPWGQERRLWGGLRAEGRAQLGEKEYLFAPAHSFAVAAEEAGPIFPRGMGQRAVAAGWTDHAAACLWLCPGTDGVLIQNGAAYPLGPARWEAPESAGAAWRISLDAGWLTFTPSWPKREKTAGGTPSPAGVFGRFQGLVAPPGGGRLPIRQMAGVAELEAAVSAPFQDS